MSDLDDLTMDELRVYAVDLGVPGISRLRKDELISAIEESEGGDGLASPAEPEEQATRFQAGSDEFGIFCLDTRTGRMLGGRFADNEAGQRIVSGKVDRNNNGPVQPPRTQAEKEADLIGSSSHA